MQVKEIELIKKAKKKDMEAYGALYEMHLKRIYRYLLFQVKDRQTAEDLCEQAFLKAWQKLDKYRFKKNASFAAWLFAIARNSMLDHFRKNRPVSLSKVSEPETNDRLIEKIHQDEQKNRLKAVIDSLPEKQRQVVILRYLEEMPYPEIAKVLGKRQGAIRVILSRALKAMRKEFDK